MGHMSYHSVGKLIFLNVGTIFLDCDLDGGILQAMKVPPRCKHEGCFYVPGGIYKRTGYCGHHQSKGSGSTVSKESLTPALRPVSDLVEWKNAKTQAVLGPLLDEFASIVNLNLDNAIHISYTEFKNPRVCGGTFNVNVPSPVSAHPQDKLYYADPEEYARRVELRKKDIDEEVVYPYRLEVKIQKGESESSLRNYFFHELMHAVDYEPSFDIVKAGHMSSAVETELFGEFLEYAKATESFKEKAVLPSDWDYMREAISDKEVWARAAAQWASEVLHGESEPDRTVNGEESVAKMHDFTAEEMETIGPMVQNILAKRGKLA